MKNKFNIRRQWKLIRQSETTQVMIITGVGMVLSMLIDILIAVRLGTSEIADALILALSLPRTIDIIAREGAKFSLMAVCVEQKYLRSEEAYQGFLFGLVNLFLVAGILITFAGWLFTPILVDLLGPGLAPSIRAESISLFRLGLPMTIFMLGSVVYWLALNSEEYFVEASFRNVLASVVILIGIGSAWGRDNFSSWVTAVHTLGYGVLFIVLAFSAYRRLNLRESPWTWLGVDGIREVYLALRFPLIGYGFTQMARIFERSIASLVAPGAVSAYYYAFRLISAVQSLIGVTIATIGLPSITQMDLEGARVKMRQSIRKRLLQVLFLSLPITVFVVLFNNQLVAFLYGRGAFNLNSIHWTSQVLLVLGIGVVFRSMVPVINSGLYAQRKFGLVFVSMFVTSITTVGAAWLLSQSLGLTGIGLGVSFAGLVSVITSAAMLQKSGIRIIDHGLSA